jgi:hypothetical protein
MLFLHALPASDVYVAGIPKFRCADAASPYGMLGGIVETSASFEARSAPRSYPTTPDSRPEKIVQRSNGLRAGSWNGVYGMFCQQITPL